jgi:hypothetical protein
MSLEVTVIVEITFSRKSEMKAIMKALIPDNVNFPKGLSMDMSSIENTLLIEFSCTTGLETLVNTIDEVLDHVLLARKVICDA